MRYQTIFMYIIILSMTLSIRQINESIIQIQLIKEEGNQIENYQVMQNNNLQPKIVTKTNSKLTNIRTHFVKPNLQANTPVKTESNITGFISTWDTTKGLHSPSTSPSSEIKLPLVSDGIYDFNVSWGDGSSNLITSYNQSAVTHTYKFLSCCMYKINITGTIIGWRFNGTGDAQKLLEISNWGPLRLGNDGYYFSGASNLYLSTTDALDLNGTTTLAGMFMNCTSLGTSGNLNSWNVSQVTDMSNMFAYDPGFNQPLKSWDVSRVTDMSGMFSEGPSFNNPLGYSFTQSLDSWDVSRVTDMSNMFLFATNFNQSLGSWNVSEVTNMSGMFRGAFNFSHPLDSWDVSSVTDMSSMFLDATNFNQSLGSWNVSKVMNMHSMFANDYKFNQPLDSWNVSQVTNMRSMFAHDSLSISNYDKLLLGWSSLPQLQHNVVFDAGFSQYGISAQNAREQLIKKFNWTVMDGGLSESSSLISLGKIGLAIIVVAGVIGISVFIAITYFEYMKNEDKKLIKDLKFWNYLKDTVRFKKHKKSAKETLNSKTFDKIEQILDENKEK